MCDLESEGNIPEEIMNSLVRVEETKKSEENSILINFLKEVIKSR
jgi:hypothetical protein